jgi:hypothetical protein
VYPYTYNSCSKCTITVVTRVRTFTIRVQDTSTLTEKKTICFLVEISSEANVRRGSWKLNVESEATTKCREFGIENPQRVLLYNKPGQNGAELMLVVLSPVCQVTGDSLHIFLITSL